MTTRRTFIGAAAGSLLISSLAAQLGAEPTVPQGLSGAR